MGLQPDRLEPRERHVQLGGVDLGKVMVLSTDLVMQHSGDVDRTLDLLCMVEEPAASEA
jgi:hypothetical protein